MLGTGLAVPLRTAVPPQALAPRFAVAPATARPDGSCRRAREATVVVLAGAALSQRPLRRRLRKRLARQAARVALQATGGNADSAAPAWGADDDLSMGISPEELVVPSGFRNRRTGILLLNIGTPASTSVEDVRSYLGRFLADDRVIDIKPPFLKYILLQILLATRPQSSAENYKRIWDPVRGSPLLYNSEDLAKALQHELGDNFLVRIGMAYSEPLVENALRSMAAVGVDDVLLVPMFPHYASSTTGSILANAYKTASEVFCTPFLRVLPPFYDNALYLDAMRAGIVKSIGVGGQEVDHVLFSFHGVPERQCMQTDDTQQTCLRKPDCCASVTRANRNCYRAQCFETARLLARTLELQDGKWSIGFQSRLTLRGTIQWIRPYTDEALGDLARKGVRKLAVLAPSFTADCVETLEELGIQGREQFEEAGGEELVVVPCLNSSPEWVQGLAAMVRDQLVVAVPRAAKAVEPKAAEPMAVEPPHEQEVAQEMEGTVEKVEKETLFEVLRTKLRGAPKQVEVNNR